ncbi:hypothetical protein CEV31_2716 [Brucella thiophenivorans]|uniref:Uncharacterized protein n=1 Tax=Brucella thiophenivorans TaxID=571255 RepID=A0A256FMG4_9HYPH|nr:hypothetical protein CEV31_2716 [Brucella thiophenivorans]
MSRENSCGDGTTLNPRYSALSALDWNWGTASALLAMKVCLFSNSGFWTAERH